MSLRQKSLDGEQKTGVSVEDVSRTTTATSENTTRPPPRKRRLGLVGRLLTRWWLLELVSLTISILAMLVAIIMLFVVNNTPLTQWTSPIQPNSMLAVAMAVSKSAMLLPISECISQSKWFQYRKSPLALSRLQEFDDASRGPLGSAQLLLRPKVAGSMAWIGAILTVISLALDPFAQQVLDFPSREFSSPEETAAVMVTRSLEQLKGSEVKAKLRASFYSDPQSPLNITCTTSTCLWPEPVISLGVCSRCRRLTNTVTPLCSTQPGPLVPEPSATWNFTTTTCNYTVAPTVSFQVYIQTVHLPAANSRPAEYANRFTRVKIFSPAVESLNLSTLLNTDARWLTGTISWVTTYNADTHPQPPLSISQLAPELSLCGFYFCTYTYPHLAITKNDATESSEVPFTNPLRPSLDQGATFESAPVYTTLPNGEKAEILVSSSPGPSSRSSNEYLIYQQPLFSLQGLLSLFFKYTDTAGNDAFSCFPDPTSGTLDLLGKKRSVESTFSLFANVITERIMVSNGSFPASGKAMVKDTFVAVQWVWMMLPVGVLVVAGGLLGGMIWRGERGEVGVWKGDTAVLLMMGLRGCEQEVEGLRRLRGERKEVSLEEVSELAEGVDIQLVRAGEDSRSEGLGWVFKTVKRRT